MVAAAKDAIAAIIVGGDGKCGEWVLFLSTLAMMMEGIII